ncbi:hypothetical protein, conserved [Trypanosoma brucei gambiense DAL972]|uniref:Uncharacterized protein n=1 Tax=Trypanosoma brucei gambiense (strain MHOM/CI/86/DAL972) TaxID=679716 RepID=D0A773_TRYB9|nr:hypothetical protein, conserved [Trypanosoma brucei gambiense DAL972]CBH17524.1 hypothetical protein, conserved [Trypanosoma brucei gambiense DAL972]|eukprot:XP_011779788.1 hypothetical protein, conserved [Trypanosoma brucei gambiense DAL972]
MMGEQENVRFLSPTGIVPFAADSPRGSDVIRRSFSLPVATVTFSLRQLNRDKCEIATPVAVENCFQVLQRHFEPYISASAVCNTCLPGSRLYLRFNKLTNATFHSEPSLLNVYVYAVDQAESRTRALHGAVREWQSMMKTSTEGSCLVMLYHQDLVDATSTSAVQAAVFGGEIKMPDQRKAEAAASAMGPYFDELGAMKFGPQQMCSYLPNEAPTRIIERLTAAYRNLTIQLTNIFNASQQRRPAYTPRGDIGLNSPPNEAWSLQRCWRAGYDLAAHYLQFGAVNKAMAIFSRMFDVYYYHSDDYNFLTKKESIEQLIRLSDMFHPASFPVQQGRYPSVLQDAAEPGAGLLFIVVCEMKCALLLERRDLAFARFNSFLQLAREKFAEDGESTKVTNSLQIVFLLRFAITAMQANWAHNGALDDHSEARCDGSEASLSERQQSHESSQRNQPHPQQAQSVTDMSSPLRSGDQPHDSISVSVFSGNSSMSMPWPDAEVELGKEVIHETVDVDQSPDTTKRLKELCRMLKLEWVEKSVESGGDKLFVQLADEVLELVSDAGALLGYSETGEVVKESAVATFGVPEVDSVDAFVSFYRALTEAVALYYRLLNYRHREHALLYKLACSFSVKEPEKTVRLCQICLLPFVQQCGWLQLQVIIHRLLVEAMERVICQRKDQQRFVLEEDVTSMKESLLRLIAACGENEPLKREIEMLGGKGLNAGSLWCRLRRFMRDEGSFRFSLTEEDGPKQVYDDEGGSDENTVGLSCFKLTGLLKYAQATCLRNKPILGDASEFGLIVASNGGGDDGSRGSSIGLQVNIGDTLYLCFEARCPFNILECDDEEEQSQGPHMTESLVPSATLVSKKDWDDDDETIHIVDVVDIISTYYSEQNQKVQWVWEFRACHAGNYRLHDITFHVGVTKLVYEHNVIPPLPSVEMFTPTETTGSPLNSFRCDFDKAETVALGCLFRVPEPDLGIKMQLAPVGEPHCFGDSLTFFDVQIDLEEPLLCMRSTPASTVDTAGIGGGKDSHTTVNSIGVVGNTCRFESLSLQVPASLGVRTLTDGGTCTMLSLDCRSTLNDTATSTTMSVQHDSSTLACLFLTRPKNCPPLRLSNQCTSVLQGLTRSGRGNSAPLVNDVIAWLVEGDGQRDSSLLIVRVKHITGAFTTVPINESFVMSQLPPVVTRDGENSTDGETTKKIDRIAQDVLPVHLDGSIWPHRKQQSCFRICLDDHDEEKIDMQKQSKAVGDSNKSGEGLPIQTNQLRLSLPLLPLYTTLSEERAHLSICREGHMDPSGGDNRLSVPIPYKMTAAFAVQYSFKCHQGRVYCLVRAKNVMKGTSLWLRGALLELVDGDRYYELSRVSSALDHLMLREWKPEESVHLFFELAPSSNAPPQVDERRHSVRVQLIYSNWSVTERLKPMEEYILRPIRSSGTKLPSPIAETAHFSGVMKSSSNWMEHTNDTPLSPASTETLEAEIGDEPEVNAEVVRVQYDISHLEKLYSSCNTFNGPLASFTSKHSCLFNVDITAQPLTWSSAGPNKTPKSISLEANRSSLGCTIEFTDGPGARYLPGDCVFPVGEPVQFTVTLDPLAHNWPEDSASEEEFIVCLKVDPAFWFAVGKQRLRCRLSMMEETVLRFTAIPLPPGEEGTHRAVSVDYPLHQYQVIGNIRKKGSDERVEGEFNAPTPTVELHSIPRQSVSETDGAKQGENVAIEVVQFSALMRIRQQQ